MYSLALRVNYYRDIPSKFQYTCLIFPKLTRDITRVLVGTYNILTKIREVLGITNRLLSLHYNLSILYDKYKENLICM